MTYENKINLPNIIKVSCLYENLTSINYLKLNNLIIKEKIDKEILQLVKK